MKIKVPEFTAESSFYERENTFQLGKRMFGFDYSKSILPQRRADFVCYFSCMNRGGSVDACFDECSGWRPTYDDLLF
jgi:hypothetical protein